MEIASGVQANRWHQLQLDDPLSNDWIEAIQILENRINERYLVPAAILIDDDEPKPPADRTSGFSIMAINCLLVETLESFKQGIVDTSGKSKDLFTSFLTTQPEFAPPFTSDFAKSFYEDIRCGILHIGETQKDAKIWSIRELVCLNGNSIRVNRTLFHQKLVVSFQAYISDLAEPANSQLRCNFRTKMDFIAR